MASLPLADLPGCGTSAGYARRGALASPGESAVRESPIVVSLCSLGCGHAVVTVVSFASPPAPRTSIFIDFE